MVAPIPLTFNRLAPDTVLEIGGRRWLVVIGSGHSPEHACLYCPEAELMIGGDFLLPRISPNISVWWNEPDGNPLQDYLKFLESLDPIADETERQSVVQGKSVSVRVDLGGRRILKKNTKANETRGHMATNEEKQET